jgi:hypothetical protein
VTPPKKNHGGRRTNAGRKKGDVSAKTLRLIAIAAAESQAKDAVAAAIEEARTAGLMEGKDRRGVKRATTVLEEFMLTFAGMAAVYQPLPHGAEVPPGRQPDDAKFQAYAKLAVDTAGMLANYQGPKFKAVMLTVAPPVPAGNEPRPGDDAKVVGRIGNPALVYQRMIRGVG